jgi:hypothetical protein
MNLIPEDLKQIESIKGAAQELLGRIQEQGVVMGAEFMDVLEQLAIDPVRKP